VAGLHVLGTDVLSDVLDVTEVDLLDLTTTQLTAVDALVGTLTGALSEVLSTVPLFPDLAVPAPQVDVLVADPSTGVVDGFGVASAIVQLLQVTLPPITLPLDLALPGAASLPVFGAGDLSALAVGDLVSQELSLGIGSLGPSARFRPAVSAAAPGGTPTPTPTPTAPGTGTTRPPTTTTTTSGRPLPATGAPALLGAAGLALLAGAALVRRRRDADLDDAAGLSDA
jgi:LPXTG-motif cell wall-anchored protein